MRRRRAEKRVIQPDPRYNSVLVAKLINIVMKWGQKTVAQRIVYRALEEIAAKNPGQNPVEILERAVENVKPRLEVKSRRIGGATYQVPVEVPADRQVSLALRWIARFSDERKGVPMFKALASEIMDAYQGQGASIRKRDEVHRMAQANRAFAHFRW